MLKFAILLFFGGCSLFPDFDEGTNPNPNTLTLPTPVMDLNLTDGSKYTLSGLGQKVDQVESQEGRVFVSGGTDKAAFNTKNLYTVLNARYTHNDLDDFKFLHDGSSWTIGFRVRFDANVGNYTYLFGTNSNSSANTGVSVVFNDKSPNDNGLQVMVSTGVTGKLIVNKTVSNFFTLGQFASVVLTYNGTTLSIYRDGTLISTATKTAGVTPSTGDHSFGMTAFAYNNNTYYSKETFLKRVLVYNSVESATDIGTELANGSDVIGDGTAVNLYMLFGQSNGGGFLTTAQAPDSIKGEYDRFIYKPVSFTSNSITSEWVKYQIGVTSNPADNTRWGPEAQFLREMPSNTYLCKYTVNSTYLAAVAGLDWNASSTSEHLYRGLTQMTIGNALRELRNEFNYNVTVRGLIMAIGENDALDTAYSNAHGANMAAVVNKVATDIGATKMRVAIIQTNVNLARPGTAAIRSGQGNVVSTLTHAGIPGLTLISSDAETLQPDAVHISPAGQVNIGHYLSTYFNQYTSE